MKDILIIGAGWLGLPLAGHLLSQGYRVHGTTTQPDKLAELKRWGLKGHLYGLGDDPAGLPKADQLIFTVPPTKGGTGYAEKAAALFQHLAEQGTSQAIYTSSTAVYSPSPNYQNEDAPASSTEGSAPVLLLVEQQLRSTFSQALVVRLGGLIGPGRHPGRFLGGKKELSGGDVPVNYTSLEDACRLILELIVRESVGTYNVVTPSHPKKSEFYSFASAELGFEPPQFDPVKALEGYKCIDGRRVAEVTSTEYLNTDWKRYLLSLRR